MPSVCHVAAAGLWWRFEKRRMRRAWEKPDIDAAMLDATRTLLITSEVPSCTPNEYSVRDKGRFIAN